MQLQNNFFKKKQVDRASFALLFCAAFSLLEKEWAERNASYLDFPIVIKVFFIFYFSRLKTKYREVEIKLENEREAIKKKGI
jgi:hypothetical protein